MKASEYAGFACGLMVVALASSVFWLAVGGALMFTSMCILASHD